MTKLFVYGVNSRCPREDLEEVFGKYGEVTDVYITGKGKHINFILFWYIQCARSTTSYILMFTDYLTSKFNAYITIFKG